MPGCEQPIEQEFELFNIKEDPEEKYNVIEEHPDVVAILKEELSRCLDAGRHTPGAQQENYVPDYPWVQINWR